MRIAVTYENGNIGQHFGHTENFKVYDIQNNEINDSCIIPTNGSGHGALADFLGSQNIDVLICGGIGAGAQNALNDVGIKFYGGVIGDADIAVKSLLTNTLVYNPNVMCNHHNQHNDVDHICGANGCGKHHN